MEEVELEEVVRQAGGEDGVLGVQPFAVDGIFLAQSFPQGLSVRASPLLEEVEVLLADAAGEEVSATLQEQLAFLIESQAGVGAVRLLLDDDVSPLEVREGGRRQRRPE